ncbi:unnamed protein product [Rangifer tarandus platyrhynchus]|uniref:Uncharacterized protein n=1 Tax=Rangifer tarandus platyrhynchus TaxID=3082113 RepID=A0AC59ZPW1_RANTA
MHKQGLGGCLRTGRATPGRGPCSRRTAQQPSGVPPEQSGPEPEPRPGGSAPCSRLASPRVRGRRLASADQGKVEASLGPFRPRLCTAATQEDRGRKAGVDVAAGGRPVVQGRDLNYRPRGRNVSDASGSVHLDGAEASQPRSRGDVTSLLAARQSPLTGCAMPSLPAGPPVHRLNLCQPREVDQKMGPWRRIPEEAGPPAGAGVAPPSRTACLPAPPPGHGSDLGPLVSESRLGIWQLLPQLRMVADSQMQSDQMETEHTRGGARFSQPNSAPSFRRWAPEDRSSPALAAASGAWEAAPTGQSPKPHRLSERPASPSPRCLRG